MYATLEQCIYYTEKCIIGKPPKPHYRYEQYEKSLKNLLDRFGGRRETSQIIHVDIGYGPGLFSWVVHDYFKQQEPNTEIKLFAYDHCPNMIKLADLIWHEFDTGIDLGVTSNTDKLISQVERGGGEDLIVSFGHVLVQASDQKGAIDSFADILGSIRMNSNLIVAVDAYEKSSKFQNAVVDLKNALDKKGVKVQLEYTPGYPKSSWVAVLY